MSCIDNASKQCSKHSVTAANTQSDHGYNAKSHIVSVQLIPRINPLIQPTSELISNDRQRLLYRLDFYGLTEKVVKGDGNCQV